jgi:hypothetical protein
MQFNTILDTIFKILTLVAMKSIIFWDVIPVKYQWTSKKNVKKVKLSL